MTHSSFYGTGDCLQVYLNFIKWSIPFFVIFPISKTGGGGEEQEFLIDLSFFFNSVTSPN